MPNPSDRGRKLFVRSALVAGVTVATLIGAQNLALLDRDRLAPSPVPSSETELILLPPPDPLNNITGLIVDDAATPTTISHAAPNLVILRQPGTISAAASPETEMQNQSGGSTILPPNPVALQAPAPVVVQQQGQVIVQQSAPAPVQSQSSR